MDLRFTAEELAFREEVRAFIRTSLPQSIRQKLTEGYPPDKGDVVLWQRILNRKGWAVAHWPMAYSWSARSLSPSALRRRSAVSFPGLQIWTTGGAKVFPSRAQVRI